MSDESGTVHADKCPVGKHCEDPGCHFLGGCCCIHWVQPPCCEYHRAGGTFDACPLACAGVEHISFNGRLNHVFDDVSGSRFAFDLMLCPAEALP